MAEVTDVNLMVGGLPIPRRALIDSAGNPIDPARIGPPATALTVNFAEKANSTARVEGTSVGAEALVGASTIFAQATVRAAKLVTDIDKVAIANVGTVYLCRAAGNIDGAFPLEPGQSLNLFDNGDLADWFLAVDTANDGVSIAYTT